MMIKFLGSFTFVFLIIVDSVTAAEWQTPAEAVQLASNSAATVAAPAVAASAASYYAITTEDIGKEVARQMEAQGVRGPISATVAPISGTIAQADHPLTLALQALQIDRTAGLWQAQAHVMANGKTEMVKPVSGRFEAMKSIPVLTHLLKQNDQITEADLTSKLVPERQLRKDTVTEASYLVGQSPTRMISPNRPIRSAEISAPVMIKKGDLVTMHYTTPYLSIKTTGEALENGSSGALIRVKNSKTDKAISARVTGAAQVEVNSIL